MKIVSQNINFISMVVTIFQHVTSVDLFSIAQCKEMQALLSVWEW